MVVSMVDLLLKRPQRVRSAKMVTQMAAAQANSRAAAQPQPLVFCGFFLPASAV